MKKIIRLIMLIAVIFLLTVTAFAAEKRTVRASDTGPGILTESEKGAAQAMAEALAGVKESVDISKYQIPCDDDGVMLSKIFSAALELDPELFYAYQCGYFVGDGHVTKVILYYDSDLDGAEDDFPIGTIRTNVETKRAEFRAYLQDFLSDVEPGWSDFEKILRVNDKMALAFKYDTTYKISDVYRFVTQKKGVCQAYTVFFKACMDKLGIECTSASSDNINHIWNQVKLGGKWYHVDTTWNDPITTPMQTDPSAPDCVGMAYHNYFLVSDARLLELNPARSDFKGINCTDTTYDSWYGSGLTSPFVPYDGKWYYVASTGFTATLYSDETVENLSGRESEQSFSLAFAPVFSGLSLYRGSLYFNTDYAVFRFTPDLKEFVKLLEVPNEKKGIGYLYGSVISDGKLTYLYRYNSQTWKHELTETVIDPYSYPRDYNVGYLIDGEKMHVISDGKVHVIAAAYKDGKLISVKLLTCEGETELAFSGGNMKLFFLSTDGKQTPLCGAVNL